MVSSYADALAHFDKQTVKVEPGKAPNGNITAVNVSVKETGKPDIFLEFKLRKNNKTGEWKAFDMVAEGISLLSAKQSELGGLIRQDGIDAVIAQLREHNAKPLVIKSWSSGASCRRHRSMTCGNAAPTGGKMTSWSSEPSPPWTPPAWPCWSNGPKPPWHEAPHRNWWAPPLISIPWPTSTGWPVCFNQPRSQLRTHNASLWNWSDTPWGSAIVRSPCQRGWQPLPGDCRRRHVWRYEPSQETAGHLCPADGQDRQQRHSRPLHQGLYRSRVEART